MNWFTKTAEEAISFFETNKRVGLSNEEAKRRLDELGPNELESPNKENIILRFFAQLNDFMILALIAAAVVSFSISIFKGENDYIDPIIILTIVVVNAILGLMQESKAEKAIEELKKLSAPRAKVRRDNITQFISTKDVVVGDILIIETGSFICADARLIESVNLHIEESSITGESVPVHKDMSKVFLDDTPLGDRQNMVLSGSSVSYGRGSAVVVATGMDTEVGKIAKMIIEDKSVQTPLQKRLADTGKMLGIGAIIICLVIFLVGVISQISPFQMFMTSVSLAVAAIPEGLPAVVTIMLSVGVIRMSKRNAIIRTLPAVETLGSATVICSDKTGTLTQNKMKVVEISDGVKVIPLKCEQAMEILTLGSHCNNAEYNRRTSINDDKPYEGEIIGDSTEAALISAAMNVGINKNELDMQLPRITEIPFDSKRKLMTTVHKSKNNIYTVVTKGAPDVLIEKCVYFKENNEIKPLSHDMKNKILRQNGKMAQDALRVLAFAYKPITILPKNINDGSNIENDLIFVGLVGMIDPPRDEVKSAVSMCKKAGIKPVMITGDHYITACAIAEKIGIIDSFGKSVTGSELDKMSQDSLEKEINNISVFARVSPEHKVRIVKAFQKNGEIVAMTGDGVNDAPALKAADIGCAMGITGTDVAKGAAKMVLADDNFATIVEAVKEGRGIYENIRKAVHFLLSSNIGEIITIFVGILMGWPSPLLAIQLLWVNLITDSLPAIALSLEPPDKSIMYQKPYKNNKSLFSDGLGKKIALEGCMMGMLSLLAFAYGMFKFSVDNDPIIARTMAFAVLSISQLIHAFNMKSKNSIFTKDIFSNKYLVGVSITGIMLQYSVISFKPLANIFKVTSLSLEQWGIVAFLSLLPIVLIELEKKVSKVSDITLQRAPQATTF